MVLEPQLQVILLMILQIALFKVYSYDNSAQITCLSNDYKYSNWIKKIIDYYVDKNDLVILISASGESQNMINAARFCVKKNLSLFH